MRRIFNAPIFGITEIIKYVMLVSAAFSLAENEWVEGNIAMHLIPEKLSEKGRSILSAIMNYVLGILLVYVTYLMFQQSYAHMGTYVSTLELSIPMWLPELILVIGVGAMAFIVLAKAVMWTWMTKNNVYMSFVHLGIKQLRDQAITETDDPSEQLESKGVN